MEWGRWEAAGLPMLRVLNVSHNQLGGTLPFEWSQLHAVPSLRTL